MKKISKSDTTPEMEERANTGIARLQTIKSKHFTVGTFVQMDNKTMEVLDVVERPIPYRETYLLVRFDDGSMRLIKPYALNRRTQ